MHGDESLSVAWRLPVPTGRVVGDACHRCPL